MSVSLEGIGHLQTQLGQLVKQHIEYDGSNRTEYVYTAPAEAINGSPCSVTRYSYSGVTSKVVFMKEYTSTWNSAWDVF